MQLSKVMLASIFITTIILGVVGGVVSNQISSAKTVQPAGTATVDAYQQREEAYSQLIAQANQQLDKANSQLQAMQNEVSQLKQQPAASAAVANTAAAAISADQASQIALKAVEPGQTAQKKPDLVSFEGKAAYEVVFPKGTVYVDAQSGDVLFNGTVPQQITSAKAVQIASDYLKNKAFLQVDQITFRGAQIYRVIFKDGMMVYMDLTGQITYIQKASTPAPVIVESAPSGGSNSAPAQAQPPKHETEHDNGGD